MKVNGGKLIGISFNDHCSHRSKVLRYYHGASLHDEDVLALNLLQETHVGIDIGYERLKANRDIEGFFQSRSQKAAFNVLALISSVFVLVILTACCRNEKS